MTTTPLNAADSRILRRRKRIERELRALRVMEEHLNTRELLWAAFTIPGVAILCLVIAAKLHWLAGSIPLAVAGALTVGALVWWIGRRWFAFAAFIVIALVCLAFETVPDGAPASDRKTNRRIKLERAIARREAMLRAIDAR